MEDFIWLVDLRDLFKHKRHIIRLTPDLRVAGEGTDIAQHVDDVGDSMVGKTQHLHNIMMKRVEAMEKSSRSMLKT